MRERPGTAHHARQRKETMRTSTAVFLALFGAFALFGHARHSAGPIGQVGFCGLRVVCDRDPPEAETSVPRDLAVSARTREIEREMSRLESRRRELDHAAQSLDKSVRTLRELAARDRGTAVRRELDEVAAGAARLDDLRRQNEIDRASAAAHLELARAGLEPRESGPQGPLDALEGTDPATVVSSRAH